MDVTEKIKEMLEDVEFYEHCGTLTSEFDDLTLTVEYQLSDIIDNRKAPEHDSSDGLPTGELDFLFEITEIRLMDSECEEVEFEYDENEIIKWFYNGNLY